MKTINADIDLINSIITGDKQAFRTLYNKYAKNHMLTCMRYMKFRSDAEDILQEAYIKIYKDLKQYNPSKSKYSTWSNKIMINTCLMSLRKRNILNDFDQIVDFGNKLSVNENAIDNLSLQDLTNLILQLPKGYRTVFNLYVIDGFTHKEISEQLDISTGTSKTQLMKAKLALQGMIKSEDFSPKMNLCL